MRGYMEPPLPTLPLDTSNQPSASEIPARTLTVSCSSGLCNRLRVLVSGLAIAEASNRSFTMWWPRAQTSAATFPELFSNDWHVVEVTKQVAQSLPRYGRILDPQLIDILTAEEPHLAFESPTWLTMPELFPAHVALHARAADLFTALTPVAEVRHRLDSFQQTHFRPQMIGVHLRRGDFVRHRREVVKNTRSALAQVDAYLDKAPDAGILLCTDDGALDPGRLRPTKAENVREKFRQRYGARVVMTVPRSLDRNRPEAIQDALVDLLLLRETDYFVGTLQSSFSGLAVFGRDIPQVMLGSDDVNYRLGDFIMRRTYLAKVLSRVGYQRFGKNIDYPHLIRFYRRNPSNLVQDMYTFAAYDIRLVLVPRLLARLRGRPG